MHHPATREAGPRLGDRRTPGRAQSPHPSASAERTGAAAPEKTGPTRLSPRTVRLARLAVVLGLAAIVILGYLLHPPARAELERAMSILATGDGVAIGDYLRSYGVWAPVASLGLMILQAVAAPVPAILVAFANGLTFGVVWGGLLTVAGQTLAAAICFGIARAVGRGPVEALAGRFGLATIDGWFTRWGGRGILLLRLMPGISFDVVSYAAGLTGMRFGPFLLATAVGVAPQAFLYAYLIRESPQSAWLFFGATWLIIAVIAVGAFARGKHVVPRRPGGQTARRQGRELQRYRPSDPRLPTSDSVR